MSSDTYDDRATYRGSSYTSASGEAERRKLFSERSERVSAFRSEVGTKSDSPRPARDVMANYDESLVRCSITKPAPGVTRVYKILIDNSGSNRQIANHFRNSTNYLRVNLGLIDHDGQFTFEYFSDHCDGKLISQPIDYVSPNKEGERILTSTLHHVHDADGGDSPEAHECALWDACKINFGEATTRHLILVSDVTGHGMGMGDDQGCPNQRSWKESMDLVEATYTTFELIGCGASADVATLQQQFVTYRHPENLAMNFVSLAYIKEHQYRLGIVLNAFLFLVARHRGPQSVEGFLSRLYEKWLSDPLFGGETDRRAKEAIIRFAKYIDLQSKEKTEMMSRVLVSPTDEVERLLKEEGVFI